MLNNFWREKQRRVWVAGLFIFQTQLNCCNVRQLLRRLTRSCEIIRLFRQRLPHTSKKGYAIGIMGIASSSLFGWGSQCFSKKKGESINRRVHVVSLHHAVPPRNSINQQ